MTSGSSGLLLVSRSGTLSLSSDTTLLGRSVSTVFASVQQVCLLFADAGRITLQLRADLSGGFLEVGFLVHLGVNVGW